MNKRIREKRQKLQNKSFSITESNKSNPYQESVSDVDVVNILSQAMAELSLAIQDITLSENNKEINDIKNKLEQLKIESEYHKQNNEDVGLHDNQNES